MRAFYVIQLGYLKLGEMDKYQKKLYGNGTCSLLLPTFSPPKTNKSFYWQGFFFKLAHYEHLIMHQQQNFNVDSSNNHLLFSLPNNFISYSIKQQLVHNSPYVVLGIHNQTCLTHTNSQGNWIRSQFKSLRLITFKQKDKVPSWYGIPFSIVRPTSLTPVKSAVAP